MIFCEYDAFDLATFEVATRRLTCVRGHRVALLLEAPAAPTPPPTSAPHPLEELHRT